MTGLQNHKIGISKNNSLILLYGHPELDLEDNIKLFKIRLKFIIDTESFDVPPHLYS